MFDQIVAVLPARGGSKRIPRKNIRPFRGKPILVHVIEILQKSDLFNQIVVSTDDSEIKNIASSCAVDDIIDRPADLADDHTPTQPVIQHAISNKHLEDALVCCVYPCNPLLRKSTITACIEKVQKFPDRFCFPIIEYRHPIQRAFSMADNSTLTLSAPEYEISRTQDLKVHFHDAGSIYCANASIWLSEKRIHRDSCGVSVSYLDAMDIDNEADWRLAEQIYLIREQSDA